MLREEIDLVKLAADIGARLRAYREEFGLNQKDFAEGSGIPRSQLARYETGEDLPQVKAVILLSIFMEHQVDWILFGNDSGGDVPNDLLIRECMVELERASPRCRRTAIEMIHALIMADRAEARLLSAGNGAASEVERAKMSEESQR